MIKASTKLLNNNLMPNIIFSLIIINYALLSLLSFRRDNFLFNNLETFSKNQLTWLVLIIINLLLTYLGINLIKPEFNNKIKLTIIFILLIATITLPILANDITGYWLNGQLIYQELKNPYEVALNKTVIPPEMINVWWTEKPSPYGPIFLLIILLPWLISFSNLFVFIYAYKILVLAVFGLSFFIFSKLRQGTEAPPYFDVLFLLNPALIINLLFEGHNEVFIILALLLFLYFEKNYNKKLTSLITSIFIKFNTLVVWPLAWFKNKKFNVKLFIKNNLILLVASLIFLLLIKFNLYDFLTNNIFFVNKYCFYQCSPIIKLTSWLTANNDSLIRLTCFVVAYFLSSYFFLFKKHEPVKFVIWVFMALFFINTEWLTPWYPIIIIPFCLLTNNKKYLALSFLITAYSLLHYLNTI